VNAAHAGALRGGEILHTARLYPETAVTCMEYPEQQFQYDDLVMRWNERSRRSFPRGLGGAEVAGACLVMLDAEIAELVGAFIKHRSLRPTAFEALRQLRGDLQGVLPALSGESAEYFEAWEELVSQTLWLADPGES
jgi:hypothetical protein